MTSLAEAQTRFRIAVQNRFGGGCNGNYTVSTFTQSTQLTFSVPECAARVEILGGHNDGEALSNDVPRIVLTGGPNTAPLDIVVGHIFQQIDVQPTPAARDWGGLGLSFSGSGAVRLYGAINRNLTGSISVPQLSRFDVGGQIQAAITSTDPVNFGGTFVIESDSISSTGSVTLTNGTMHRVVAYGSSGMQGPVVATNGNITSVFVYNGSLSGNVRAPMGSIGTIEVFGDIGSSSQSRTILAMDGINTIDAAAIYATITSNSGGTGSIRRVRTTAGPFVGALNTYRIESPTSTDGLRITGDLDANVTILNNVLRPIVITGELKSGRTLSIAGQVLAAASPSTNGSLDIGTLRGTISFNTHPQGIRGPVTIGTIASTGRLETSSTLESGTNGSIIVDGSMVGLIQVSGNVAGVVTIGGELDGRVTTTGSLSGTLIVNSYLDGLIKIGDSLSGTIDINQSLGLRGQIIINADDMSGTWTNSGSVLIGSLTLNPLLAQPYDAPYYNALPSDLGGGSVGLAPFRLHAAACTPPHNLMDRHTDLVYTDFDNNGMPVVIRSYGPITNASVDFDMQLTDECAWHEDVDAMFVPVLHPGGDPRAIGIKCDSASSMKRGIIRVESASVACAEVAGNPLVDWTTPDNDGCISDPTPSYVFLVAPDCNGGGLNDWFEIDRGEEFPMDEWPDIDGNDNDVIDSCEDDPCACDWNADHFVDVPDIFAFLSSWFANDPSADFDGSGTIAVPDIFAFLSCWFASSDGNRCDL